MAAKALVPVEACPCTHRFPPHTRYRLIQSPPCPIPRHVPEPPDGQGP